MDLEPKVYVTHYFRTVRGIMQYVSADFRSYPRR